MIRSLVDCTIDSLFIAGKLSWKFTKWCWDGWIDCPNTKDLNLFYESTGVKNKLGEVPRVLKAKEDVYIVKSPLGLNINDYQKTKDALETYLNYQVDMELQGEYLKISKAEIKELPLIVNYKIPKKSNGELIVPFARSFDDDVSIDFKYEPHVLLTGATGSGKSVTLRNIITSLIALYPSEIELTLIDFKVVELSIFKRLKQVETYVTDIEEAKEVIADEMQICKDRLKLFEELEVNNIYDYNKKVPKSKRLKYRFMVIEEFVMLTEDKKKIAMSLLKRLSVISRCAGIFLIITGQRFDNTVIDIVIRSQIGNRLCHKMQDEANSKLILDEVGAEQITNKGRLIYKCGIEKVECQSYYISDEEVKKIIKANIKPVSKNKTNKDISINEDNKTSYNRNKQVTEGDKNNKQIKDKENDNIITDLAFIDNL